MPIGQFAIVRFPDSTQEAKDEMLAVRLDDVAILAWKVVLRESSSSPKSGLQSWVDVKLGLLDSDCLSLSRKALDDDRQELAVRQTQRPESGNSADSALRLSRNNS